VLVFAMVNLLLIEAAMIDVAHARDKGDSVVLDGLHD
jgi:hypothetical protein